MAHKWSKKGIEGYRKTHGGAYPPGQEPDPSVAYADTVAAAKLRYIKSRGIVSKEDSLAIGKEPPQPEKLSDYEKLRLRLPPKARLKADSIKAGFLPRAGKPEKPEKESLLAAGARYAEELEETNKKLQKLEDEEPIISPEEATPEQKNLLRKLETYGDSSAIMNRAMEVGFPKEFDLNEFLEGLSTARQAALEYSLLRKSGYSDIDAEKFIKSQYRMDLGDLKDFYYVETGKTNRR